MLETIQKSAVISKPRDCSFHFESLSVSPQLSSVFIQSVFGARSVRDDEIDSSGQKTFSMGVTVIPSISDYSFRLASRSPWPFLRDSDFVERLFEQCDFCSRCRLKVESDWNSLALRCDHPFGSFAFLGRTDAKPPFFAGEKLPSTKNSCHSNRCFSSSDPKKTCQTLSQMPCFSQFTSLRQHVAGLGYSCGRSIQGAPVFRTQRIPSRTSRLLRRGRPPRLLGFSDGRRGEIFSHNSSETNGFLLAIGEPPMVSQAQTVAKYNSHACYKVLK